MSKKKGTKSRNIYHRKDMTGVKNNRRIICKSCGVKHYEARYHYCIFKPAVLDLYCCAGGAGYGYYQAGFNVTGVDKEQRNNYFCDFVRSDAIEYLIEHGHKFQFIHASPPCQAYSKSTANARSRGKQYVDLVEETRKALDRVGVPYVIENVMQAPIRKDLELRGEMFGLKVIRQRKFEFGGGIIFDVAPPTFKRISVIKGEAVIVVGSASYHPTGHGKHGEPGRKIIIPEWRLDTVRKTWCFAMGIKHYMRENEIAESIPPAYTYFIGSNLKL